MNKNKHNRNVAPLISSRFKFLLKTVILSKRKSNDDYLIVNAPIDNEVIYSRNIQKKGKTKKTKVVFKYPALKKNKTEIENYHFLKSIV
jgi:hypothetical protein